MRRFHLIVGGDAPSSSTRIDFDANDSDQALCLAENHSKNCDVELWEGDTLVAYMDRRMPRLWKIGSRPSPPDPGQSADIPTS